MRRGDPPTRSISRSQNVLVLPAARRSGRLLDLWPRRPKHSARFRRTLKFFRQTNAGVTIRSIHQLLLHKEDASSAIKTLMNNSGGQRSAVRCFSSLAIDRAAFGVAWKCSAGSQHLPRIPYESGDRRSFPCEWANCSDGRARRRKDRLHGHAVENCRPNGSISTRSRTASRSQSLRISRPSKRKPLLSCFSATRHEIPIKTKQGSAWATGKLNEPRTGFPPKWSTQPRPGCTLEKWLKCPVFKPASCSCAHIPPPSAT